MGTNLGSLGVFLTTEKRLAFPILVPFARASRFSAGLDGSGRGPQTWQQFADAAAHVLLFFQRFPSYNSSIFSILTIPTQDLSRD
jgi:hypothetical protein